MLKKYLSDTSSIDEQRVLGMIIAMYKKQYTLVSGAYGACRFVLDESKSLDVITDYFEKEGFETTVQKDCNFNIITLRWKEGDIYEGYLSI